jgi:predicted Rossmann-fold nucleotide-binding protein
MKYKIGIFGSSAGTDIEKSTGKARQIGQALGKQNVIVITGACAGLPYEAANAAHKLGTEIWGYSQAQDLEHQQKLVPSKKSIYTKLIYIPKSYEFAADILVTRKYRNVSSTANCDAGIIISGRWGTLNEFTNLYDMGKVIGVLTGTRGIADELETLNKKIYKPGKAKIIFNNEAEELVNQIIEELAKIEHSS